MLFVTYAGPQGLFPELDQPEREPRSLIWGRSNQDSLTIFIIILQG
jgi:hypothetical protein